MKDLLTKSGSEGLGEDFTVAAAAQVELLFLKPLISVVDVVVDMLDTLVDLSLCLGNRFSHLESDQLSVFLPVLSQDLLKVAHLFKSAWQSLVSDVDLLLVALVGSVHLALQAGRGESLEGLVDFVVFRVH